MARKPFPKSKHFYAYLKCQTNIHISQTCIEPATALQTTARASILKGNTVMHKTGLGKKQSKQVKNLLFHHIPKAINHKNLFYSIAHVCKNAISLKEHAKKRDSRLIRDLYFT